MMRLPPTVKPPEVAPNLEQRRAGGKTMSLVTQVRQYELITPLFGGGVEPGCADPVTVIRGPEIRGHLRFWWRACRGGQFNDLAAMKAAEDDLWGAASTERNPRPSQVQVAVTVDSEGIEEHPFSVVAGKPDRRAGKPRPKVQANEQVAPAYAAFPLQPSDPEVKAGGIGMPTKSVQSKVKFALTLTFPRCKSMEVEAAIWAWETFGGIGARTRRGFGALKLVALNNVPIQHAESRNAENMARANLRRHVVDGVWPDGVPHLSHATRMVIKDTPGNAWNYLCRRLKEFRQAEEWPEADAIRNIKSGKSLKGLFPRAAMGLPIVFHFKDSREPDPTLQGAEKKYERLASPLILRPLACAGNKTVAVALILEGTDIEQVPDGLILSNIDAAPNIQTALTAAEARTIQPLNGNTDVLQAFLDTL